MDLSRPARRLPRFAAREPQEGVSMSGRLRLVGAVVCALGAAPLAAQPLALEFEPGLVRVSGLAPGGSAALLGVARVYEKLQTSVVRVHELLVDDDADGTVELLFERERVTTPNSIWVAADLASGSWLAAAPPSGALVDGETLAPAVETVNGGAFLHLALESKSAEILFVRPGEGAWRALASDGAWGDGDESRDGRLRVVREVFRPLGGEAAAPNHWTANDLVVAIEPDTLRVVARRVGQLPEEAN
jgi:hypothetical protein